MNKNDMFICLYYLSFIQNPYFYILIQVELNCLCSLKLKKKPQPFYTVHKLSPQ